MINTISAKDVIERVAGAFLLGGSVGFVLGLWLAYKDSRKQKPPPTKEGR